MNKASQKLTKIQSKALDFIRTSVERSGTAPTLRELGNFMGYSAIGSAQDLVASLRKKGYLHTPARQTARSLILSSRALALSGTRLDSTNTTFTIPGFESIPSDQHPLDDTEAATCNLKMSVAFFQRPYPDSTKLFAWQWDGENRADAGILKGDWLVFESVSSAEEGETVLVRDNGKASLRSCQAEDDVLGKLLALQRIVGQKPFGGTSCAVSSKPPPCYMQS